MPLSVLWAIALHLPSREPGVVGADVALELDPDVACTEDGLTRLQADLESRAWDLRYGHLRSLPELDLGHRLLIAELGS